MNCKSIEHLLCDLAAGELGGSDSESVREHFQHCASCKALWDEISATVSASRSWAVPQFGPSYWESRRKELLTRRQQTLRVPLRVLAASAACLLLIVSSLSAFRLLRRPTLLSRTDPALHEPSVLPAEEEMLRLVEFMNEEDTRSIIRAVLVRE